LAAPKINVGSRIAQRPADVLTAHNFAGHAVRPSQQRGCLLHLAAPKRLANRGAAYAHTVDNDTGDTFDVIFQRDTGSLQVLNRALSSARELKVVTHDDMPRAQSVNHDTTQEIIRRNVAHLAIEARAVKEVNATRGERVVLLTEPHQPSRRTVFSKKLLRRRLETHDDGRQPTRFRCGDDSIEQLLMTEMQAIVSADRDNAASPKAVERHIV
jgi:hypothetical protein